MKSKQTLLLTYDTRKPPAMVEVEIDSKFPEFGIGLNPGVPGYWEGKWAVFHIPSQTKATDSNLKANCKNIIKDLTAMGDWNRPRLELARDLLIAAARYIAEAHLNEFSPARKAA